MIIRLVFYFLVILILWSWVSLIFNVYVYRTLFLIFFMVFILFLYPGGFIVSELNFIDTFSITLILLRCFVTLLMLYSRYKVKRFDENFKFYYLLIIVLLFFLVLSFITKDLLMFYFYFEVSLLPTLIIIIGWGYQPERLQAGVYFIFYTLFASLPLLLLINYLFYEGGNLVFYVSIFNLMKNYIKGGIFFYLGVFLIGTLAFLVKLPIYFGHLWLPKAHVEAPVAGSMILAGVLLKLGGYGILRTINYISVLSIKFSHFLMGLRLARIIFVGILCTRLNDFKALVAYSSVAHIAIVICGLFRFYLWGWIGSFLIMVRHGISSSGLFCIVNLYYERTVSRRFYVNKGMLLLFPVFSLFLFMFRAANIAAPPTINLVSEIFLIVRILSYDKLMLLFFPIGSFLGAVFTLFMFSYSQHGAIYNTIYSLVFPSIREYHILLTHLIPINLIVLNCDLFILL